MKTFLTFLKNKAVIGGIVMAIFYQVVFIGLFMSGYSAIPRNIPEMTVAIVNEDDQQGKQIAEGLQQQLPFKLETDVSLDEAKKELNDRDIHMIVHIPQDFTDKLMQQGDPVPLDFMINQSNPAMVTSSMQSVVTQITAALNSQIAVQSAEGTLKGLDVPDDQAKQMAEGMTTKLVSNIISTNPVPAGMHNQMAPMFLTMVSYVGAMIFSMILIGVTNGLKNKLGKWKAFLSFQGVSLLTSLIAPLIGLGIYFSIQGGYGGEVFAQMWMLHALEMLAAIEFTGIFVFLFGQGGMLVNLTFLLTQTITGGAVLARDMMPGLFKPLSYISLMYYTIQADFNVLFGGGKTEKYVLGIIIIAVLSMIIGAIIYHIKSKKSMIANDGIKSPAIEA